MAAKHLRFHLKLAAFLLPVCAYLVLTVGAAFYSGEFTPLREVALAQAGPSPLLYGRAYRDNYFAFKLVSAQVRKPEILVLGSSRSMQMRSELFSRRGETFYNAGGAVQSVYEIREFLNALGDSALPKLLVLGLDQPWFNTRTAQGFSKRRVQEQMDEERVVPLNRAMNVGKYVAQDLLSGKISLRRAWARRDPQFGVPARGIAAVCRGSGFRNDGSYQYESLEHPKATANRLAEGYQRLRDDIGHFSRGDSVSVAGLAEIASILDFCRAKGIFVEAFSPPFAPSIARAMAVDGSHRYLAASTAALDSLFRDKGFVYGDFTDPATLGVEDDDMVDGFHGSEFVYLKMHLALLEKLPEGFRARTDMAFLKERAQGERPFRLMVFGPWPQ